MGNGDLPLGWLKAKLTAAIQPRGEKALPSEHPDLPFLGMDHVEAQTTRIIGSVSASSMKSSAARFYAGDVLYGRLRPYLNKVAQPPFAGLASAEFIVFPDTKQLYSKFLRFRLNAADFVSFASHLNEGDRPRVSFEQIGEFEILIPPLAEQHRIVAMIEELFSELDQGVASLKTAREQLKVYRQSLLKNAFEGKLTAEWRAAHRDQLETAEALQQRIARERAERYRQQLSEWEAEGKPGSKPKAPKPLPPLTTEELAELPELPEGWKWFKLADLSDVSGGLTKNQKRNQLPLRRPFLRVANVYANRLDLADVHEIAVGENEFERVTLKDGDLLVVEGNGSIDQIGRVALWRSQIEGCVHQNHLIKARPLNIVDSRFLLHFLMSESGRKFIVQAASSTSGLHTLSISKVEGLFVPYCSPTEQAEALAKLESKLSEADQLNQTLTTALQQADALRQSILKKAFSGQLVPQDENDEPAAVLLERIRAERSADKPARRGRSSGSQS